MTLPRSAVLLLAFSGLSGLLTVALAAWAAHGLAAVAPAGDQAVVWFVQATDFQMSHTLAVVLMVLVALRLSGLAAKLVMAGAWLQALAIVLFPGSLYSISFGGPGILAPFGGFAAMIGWALLAVSVLASLRQGAAAFGAARPHPAE
jgi:uncharacterized membrane protein YgdD (TMEM256/DUF423 family)